MRATLLQREAGTPSRRVRLDVCAVVLFLSAVLLALWSALNAPWAGLWFFAVLSGLGLLVLGHLYRRLLSEQIARCQLAEARAERYRLQRDEARADMLEKNQFLAAASHDLRQPVYAIGLFAGMLELQLREHDTNGVLGKIQQSVQVLSSLFDGILDISRLDARAVENHPEPVCLDALLSRLQSEYELMAIAKGLSLKIDAVSGKAAHVDPTLIQRVLMNLVSNAIKFTEEGEICIRVEDHGEKLILIVTDTGCGIARDQMDDVFVEYRQIRTAHCKGDTGRGLGLAIVKRLCELMCIPIQMSSTPGLGTRFQLSLDSAHTGHETPVEPRHPCGSVADPDASLRPARTPQRHQQYVRAATAA